MSFFAVFLQKLEPSCEIGSYSAAIIRKVLYRKWPPLALLCHSIVHYSRISYLQRGVKPQYLRSVCVLCREENPHDRKAVISMTTSPSITLLLNLHQVPISLSSTVPEVFIAIMQYPEVLPLLKLKVLPNFSCPIN